MATVDKETLQLLRSKLVPVLIPELGADAIVYVRTISGWERSEIEAAFAGKKPMECPGEFRAAILVRSICDETGKRLFSNDETRGPMDIPAGVSERLFDAACKINGFTKSDVEELEKN